VPFSSGPFFGPARLAASGRREGGVSEMKNVMGSAALLCGFMLLGACSKSEPPKEEPEVLAEAPKSEAEAQAAAETILTSLKAPAAVGLNVPVTIQLDKNGNPVFMGSTGSGIICGNPMCQPPSLKDKSYGFDSNGDLTLNNWDGAVQFIITVAAPGYSFPTDPTQAVAIVAGTAPPGKGQWNSQFTNPIGSPDLKTISFSDKNSQNGVWEYSE
jgi:hypothetical protein